MSPYSGSCGFTLTKASVVQSVIRAFELHDLVASGCGAGQRMACIVTSVPLLPKRTISTGKRLQISSASSHSMSCGMPNIVPVVRRFQLPSSLPDGNVRPSSRQNKGCGRCIRCRQDRETCCPGPLLRRSDKDHKRDSCWRRPAAGASGCSCGFGRLGRAAHESVKLFL